MKDISKLNLGAVEATPKKGNEQLTFNEKNIGYSLLEFWQWSVSDILSNSTRGKLAEFIVGTAMNINPKKLRDEWDAFDIKTENGIKIEIKSSAYIQSWDQKKFSTISFSIKKAKHWDNSNKNSRGEAKRHADLYVFCLLTTKDQNIIDPLKLEQWDFYVLPTHKLDNYKRSQSSITIGSLQKLTKSVSYSELKMKINNCYYEQNEYIKHSNNKHVI